jgi:predicted amidohydrolase YtcJ
VRRAWAGVVAGAASLAFAVPACGEDADLLLTNGRVYTVDAARSWKSAIVIRGDRIVYVGDDATAARHAGPGARRVDLQGRLVLPGFRDSHVHPVSAGVELQQCNLNDAANATEVEALVRACVAAAPSQGGPDRAWVVGGGWQLSQFPGGAPRKQQLDALVGDRPALLSDANGHTAWVSSAALAAAGITRETPDPPHGRIDRDPETGEPSGTLQEEAIALVAKRAPPVTAEQRRDGLRRALAHLHRLGIVAFQEASADDDILQTYLDADREGWLSARVRVSLHADAAGGLDQVADLLARRRQRSSRVAPDAVKLFLDGVIEARTAALLEPYLDKPGTEPASAPRGIARAEPAALAALVTALDREGFQVHMHAIGDAAIRMGLDAVAAARAANGRRDARHHMAHIQLFDPADVARFRALGVVANFQPLWAYADPFITDLTEPFLGPARSRWLYPIRSLLRSGATVVAGSDWSVSSANPLEAIEVALTRRGPAEGPGPAWIPEERAELADMIAAYTIGGAYLDFEEQEAGSIEAGKRADLVVLDRDLFAIPPHEIGEARVLWTLAAGRTVWRAEE